MTKKKTNSRQEDFLADVIKSIYRGPIRRSWRPDLLRSERTNVNLELDIYLPEINVAFEYQGAVHFQKVARYNNNPDKSRLNDTIKQQILFESFHGRIALVEIFECDIDGNLRENILKRILNAQEYYFSHGRIRKCISLEKAYIIFKSGCGLMGYNQAPIVKAVGSPNRRPTLRFTVEYLEKLYSISTNKRRDRLPGMRQLCQFKIGDGAVDPYRPIFDKKNFMKAMKWKDKGLKALVESTDAYLFEFPGQYVSGRATEKEEAMLFKTKEERDIIKKERKISKLNVD